jgi:hypothetical protein
MGERMCSSMHALNLGSSFCLNRLKKKKKKAMTPMGNRIPVAQPVVYSLHWFGNPFKYINLKYPI